MSSTELFLVLKPYVKKTDTPFYLNIFSRLEAVKLKEYFSQILYMIDFFRGELLDGFYDKNTMSDLLSRYDDSDLFYANRITFQLINSLKSWSDWKEHLMAEESDTFKYFSTPVSCDILCECAKRKISKRDSVFLVINHDAFACQKSNVEISCNDESVSLSVLPINLIEINQWLAQYRTPARKFEFSEKHGCHGVPAFTSSKGSAVSQLKCTIEQAKKYLQYAVGADDKVLFFYDSNESAYIEFRKHLQLTYHGFHLSKSDESRVPQEIKKKLRDLGMLR